MRSVKSLIGLPVIRECRALGYVCAAIPDGALHRLERVYFSTGGGLRFVTADEVDCLGEVAVLVRAPGVKSAPPQAALPRRALSSEGGRLGAITDALIDEDTFEIRWLELSRGVFDDWMRGRLRIDRFGVLPGGEVIIESTEGGNPL